MRSALAAPELTVALYAVILEYVRRSVSSNEDLSNSPAMNFFAQSLIDIGAQLAIAAMFTKIANKVFSGIGSIFSTISTARRVVSQMGVAPDVTMAQAHQMLATNPDMIRLLQQQMAANPGVLAEMMKSMGATPEAIEEATKLLADPTVMQQMLQTVTHSSVTPPPASKAPVKKSQAAAADDDTAGVSFVVRRGFLGRSSKKSSLDDLAEALLVEQKALDANANDLVKELGL